ncbi:glycine-rich RNA-binding protein GRP1A-like [Ipomoea triloba]|uniref:glycine-rich RNA-binding protein GRP1A-like n=1 Tax=Ipomoea triloba TaxID=35885 RepID=UPI00125D9487|nr:glycine-rich RNA-binding protein GRP1A-like [Ipomoea triloba]
MLFRDSDRNLEAIDNEHVFEICKTEPSPTRRSSVPVYGSALSKPSTRSVACVFAPVSGNRHLKMGQYDDHPRVAGTPYSHAEQKSRGASAARFRAFRFVMFRDELSMRDVIEGMNGQSLDGRSITVNEAQSQGSGGGGVFRGGRRERGGSSYDRREGTYGDGRGYGGGGGDRYGGGGYDGDDR